MAPNSGFLLFVFLFRCCFAANAILMGELKRRIPTFGDDALLVYK